MPSNRANTTSQTLPSSCLDHGQPTHFGTFVKSMYLHMSHISSFSNNYASNLKLKDITLYSQSHKQELLTQFRKGIPHALQCILSLAHGTYVHRDRTRAVSCRLCVQCTQCMCNARNACNACARGSWLFRTDYHVAFPHVVIG